MFVPIFSRKMKSSQKCLVRPVWVSATFQLIQVCSNNVLWFAKLSGRFSDGFMVVVPIVGVSTYGISCLMCYRVLEVCHFLDVWETTVVVNACFEEAEPLVPIQRITCEIINWFLGQTHCVLYHQCLVLHPVWWRTRETWETLVFVVVKAVVIVYFMSGTIVQWLSILWCVPMAHDQSSLAIDVKWNWLLQMPWSFLPLKSVLSSNMVLLSRSTWILPGFICSHSPCEKFPVPSSLFNVQNGLRIIRVFWVRRVSVVCFLIVVACKLMFHCSVSKRVLFSQQITGRRCWCVKCRFSVTCIRSVCFCSLFALSMVMFSSADSLASIVKFSFVSSSLMSSLQLLSNCSRVPKFHVVCLDLRYYCFVFWRAHLLRSTLSLSAEVVAWGCSLLLKMLWTFLACWLC